MELGKHQVNEVEDQIDCDAAQVQDGGRIVMPASFDNMRELLDALDSALPKNAFLKRWLQSRVNKSGGNERRGFANAGRGRGRRVMAGRYGGRGVRYREAGMGEYNEWDEGTEVEEQEVGSQASEEIGEGLELSVLDVNKEQCKGACLQAPCFFAHSVPLKRSIHVPVYLDNIKTTALVDCGATDNFLNLSFMRKRGLSPVQLEEAKVCKLGEGSTEVTHGFRGRVRVGQKESDLNFYVMNGRSSQAVVLGYGFLASQGAVIDFGKRTVKLDGEPVTCLQKEVHDVSDNCRQPVVSKNAVILQPGEQRVITARKVSDGGNSHQISCRRSIPLDCKVMGQTHDETQVWLWNRGQKILKIRDGSVVGYVSKN